MLYSLPVDQEGSCVGVQGAPRALGIWRGSAGARGVPSMGPCLPPARRGGSHGATRGRWLWVTPGWGCGCMGLWLAPPLRLHIGTGSSGRPSGPRHVPRGCCVPPPSTRRTSTQDTATAPSGISQLAGPCRVVTRVSTCKRIKTEPCCALSPCHVSEERGEAPMQRPWPEDRP